MAFKRLMAVAIGALWLTGCAGGVNLYGEPAAKFKQAVDTTAALTRDYTVLDQRMRNAAKTASLAKDVSTPLLFSPSDCQKSSSACAIVDKSSGQTVATAPQSSDGGSVSPIIDLMAKMQVYAATLSAIAQADTSQQLEQTGTTAQKAYNDLLNGVRTHNMAAVKDIKLKPGDALVEVATSIYLERKRTKMLLALVRQGDPVVIALSDTLGSMVDEMQASYIQTQSDTIQNLVLNYNVLGARASSGSSALNGLEMQAMRAQLLSRALNDQKALNGVSQVNAKSAFTQMKNAHAKLLAALELAATPKGVSEAALATMSQAIDDFTDAALQAVSTMNVAKDWY